MRGIGMLHFGLSQRHVAIVLGVSQSVVSRMWNWFITTGNVRHLHAGGQERSTNEVQDQFLVVQAWRHRFDNATTLRRDFQNATGVRISTQTIRNWLHDAGLRSRRPAIRVPLTWYHVQMRLAWARAPKSNRTCLGYVTDSCFITTRATNICTGAQTGSSWRMGSYSTI